MSGEVVRNCAILGNDGELSRILKDRANPASQDEFGLTALHYAVWNGHIECVKYLVCNNFGVDKNGNKGFSLNLTSCKGYTALHLCAMDCPSWVCKDTALLLLMFGVDLSIRDNDGYTAEELAVHSSNEEYISALQKFNSRHENEEVKLELETRCQGIIKTHYFQVDSPEQPMAHWKANFPPPQFLYKKERVGFLPNGMKIHEHHILPLVDAGEDMAGLASYRCLDFSTHQAAINKERREKLLMASDPTWAPLPEETDVSPKV